MLQHTAFRVTGQLHPRHALRSIGFRIVTRTVISGMGSMFGRATKESAYQVVQCAPVSDRVRCSDVVANALKSRTLAFVNDLGCGEESQRLSAHDCNHLELLQFSVVSSEVCGWLVSRLPQTARTLTS